VREYGGVLFVNCGSVGKPKDGDPRASFAVLTDRHGDLAVAVERVEYDASAVANEIRNVGLPHELADQLLHGA
jgi:diadenosine tetraphosphatase ApaH/serine/threonine PP2A family protein phosphatase